MPRWGVLIVVLGVACSPSSPPSAACAKDSPPGQAAQSAPAPTSTGVAGIPLDIPRAGDSSWVPPPPPAEPPPGGVNLPPSKTSESYVPAATVDVTANGQFWFNGKEVSNPEDLLKLAEQERRRDPNVRVIIRADADVPFKRVILAVDMMRRAGIAKYAFGVTPTPP
ncbi:MAG: biopolymer transporter ExbD [Polyangiaceae bacterium]|nr:biopolymer transporter ExbD [Polyangiaceae bacterium]